MAYLTIFGHTAYGIWACHMWPGMPYVARVGPAFRAAARRRAWEKSEADRREESRRAHWRAYVRGRGLMRGQLTQ
jgi:hypothetical protein